MWTGRTRHAGLGPKLGILLPDPDQNEGPVVRQEDTSSLRNKNSVCSTLKSTTARSEPKDTAVLSHRTSDKLDQRPVAGTSPGCISLWLAGPSLSTGYSQGARTGDLDLREAQYPTPWLRLTEHKDPKHREQYVDAKGDSLQLMFARRSKMKEKRSSCQDFVLRECSLLFSRTGLSPGSFGSLVQRPFRAQVTLVPLKEKILCKWQDLSSNPCAVLSQGLTSDPYLITIGGSFFLFLFFLS